MNEIKKIFILTIAKVGSSDFLYSLQDKYNVYHGHSTKKLKEVLENESNIMIICGIRNPLDRNLSYLFQTYNDNCYNDVKISHNHYKGEYCYIKNFLNLDIETIISEFFKKDYHLIIGLKNFLKSLVSINYLLIKKKDIKYIHYQIIIKYYCIH